MVNKFENIKPIIETKEFLINFKGQTITLIISYIYLNEENEDGEEEKSIQRIFEYKDSHNLLQTFDFDDETDLHKFLKENNINY